MDPRGSWSHPAQRQQQILRVLEDKGHQRVSDLSSLFQVSEITIRRDLDLLESKGKLERTHGGALPTKRLQGERDFHQKYNNNQNLKRALARAAAGLVEPGELIFVNSGTTMLTVMEELAPLEVEIFTNNGGILSHYPGGSAEFHILGGQLRATSMALVGEETQKAMEQLYPSKTFLGADGFNLQSGLTSPNKRESQVSRKMIHQTRGEVILVADHTKMGVVSKYLISPASKVNILVCDSGLDPHYKQEMEEAGIRVVLANENL